MINTKKYTHVLFDLDHTLWDFDRCATETLTELYHKYQFDQLGVSSPADFCQVFHSVNRQLWDLYNRGEYDSERLRRERFFLIFDELQLTYDASLPPLVAQEYLAKCPTKGYVISNAITTLDKLYEKYQLHIVTNGFSDVQATKLSHAGLSDYFQTVVTSDQAGYRKPHVGMFDYTLRSISATPQQCIMIGDNLEADIVGAQNAGIDQIYFNPNRRKHSATITHEISSLSDLLNIL